METLNEFKTKYENMSPDELIKQMFELSNQLFELKRILYGSKSEKGGADYSGMKGLFDEFELLSKLDSDEDKVNTTESETTKPPKKKHGKKKREISPLLARKTEYVDLPEDQKTCEKHNVPLTKVGETKQEKIEYIPASIQVVDVITCNYKCACCEKENDKTDFISAKKDPDLIPGSVVTPSLLAHIIVSKFDDGLPLYRQQEMFQRIGLSLQRSTMARWSVKAGLGTTGLINLMKSKFLDLPSIHIDETPVQVLREPHRPATANSYMWCMGSQGEFKAIVFEYHQGRNKKAAISMLDGYTGYVTADGYGVYESLANESSTHRNLDLIDMINQKVEDFEGVSFKLAGCMAHARRKFDSAEKQAKKEKTIALIATQAKKRIGQLYAIEEQIKDRLPDEKLKIRQEKSVPILEDLKKWLTEMQPQVAPQSLTGKAINYTLNQWDKLVRYCESGHVNIDNNFIERAIRQFVIGRNNWIFIATPDGADATANLYSLVETAKLSGLCPNSYLTKIFKELPKCNTQEDLEKLLPYNISKYHTINPYVRVN